MLSINELQAQSVQSIDSASSVADIESVRVALLGKKGSITEALKGVASLSIEERKTFGAEVNQLKQKLAELIDTKRAVLELQEIEARIANERIDVTLPVRPEQTGRIHPISMVMAEVAAIFGKMGFSITEGPEIDDDFHNFTALNFPEGHPAREMHDTFYLPDSADGRKMLLRTHTSNMQVRVMKAGKPPFRVLAPGKTYRSDSDMTHTPMFHQIEGFIIDREIHMGHLKGCLTRFVREFFAAPDVPVRFRSSFFPFTEPSAEVDIGCSRENGVIKIGKGKDWLEILGCGMVHPNVLKNCGINPDEWQGFAFGMGVERLAMLKYGIPDLRTFFDSDARWLKHYGFNVSEVAA